MANFILRILIICIGLLFPLLLDIQKSEADEWYTPDDLKVQAFYGRSKWTSIGPDPQDDYSWTNISIYDGYKVFSWLEFNAGLGPGYIHYDSHGSTPTAELRLMGHLHYKFLYFELAGGFAFLFDRDNLPDLASSNMYNMVSGSAGIEIFRLDGAYRNLYCRAGYRVDHLSSLFHSSNDGDRGLNIGAIELTLGWDF